MSISSLRLDLPSDLATFGGFFNIFVLVCPIMVEDALLF